MSGKGVLRPSWSTSAFIEIEMGSQPYRAHRNLTGSLSRAERVREVMGMLDFLPILGNDVVMQAQSHDDRSDFIGVGLYSLAEAAWLSRVPKSTIRDWLIVRDLWEPRVRQDGEVFLDFLDLLEIRVVRAIRKHRYSHELIRKSIRLIQACDGSSHPLISGRLFLEWRNEKKRPARKRRAHIHDNDDIHPWGRTLIDAVSGQLSWEEVLRLDDVRQIADVHEVTPKKLRRMWDTGVMVSTDVGYDEEGRPKEWRPLEEAAPSVVVDPLYSFGKPSIRRTRTPASIVSEMVQVYGREGCAREMGLTAAEVADAIRFQNDYRELSAVA